ncbi:MAG: hypothetical protein ABI867_22580 [Kofleriaceae bacterium]
MRLVAIAMVVACAAPRAAVVENATRPPGLELRGNTVFTTAQLLEAVAAIRCDQAHATAMYIASPNYEVPACKSLADQALTLDAFYADRGYYEVSTVASGSAIEIHEGPIYHFGPTKVIDGSGPSLAEPGDLGFAAGALYNRAAVYAARRALMVRYDDAGYGLVDVDINQARGDVHRMDCTFTVLRNHRATIGTIEVRGTHARSDDEIIAMSGLVPGMAFTNRMVDAAKDRFAGFSHVEILKRIRQEADVATEVHVILDVTD